MTLDFAFKEGIDQFLTGSYSTAIHALAKYPVRLNKEERAKFVEGFYHAQKTIFG